MAINKDMKVLVVDDMATMRKIIRNMLTQEGFKSVEDADDGESAWPLLEDASKEGTPFDFIISDWNMPKMSGITLLQKIRQHETIKDTPFLMVTAESEQGNVVTAVKAGVSNFIVKPFSSAVLMEKIEKIFDK
ncbi:MAG: response regulator [Bdellovibrionales bacterium]|nr:response regulator [Bdellovibrionales bacterium]MBT3526407.1 response regulator [Bdellovibrionales bacterium]MBT7669375.1 response regulator [Bdellovibrionales bacterium]MBT7768127.1 response regulator [Bdellovibrionales bacterium]